MKPPCLDHKWKIELPAKFRSCTIMQHGADYISLQYRQTKGVRWQRRGFFFSSIVQKLKTLQHTFSPPVRNALGINEANYTTLQKANNGSTKWWHWFLWHFHFTHSAVSSLTKQKPQSKQSNSRQNKFLTLTRLFYEAVNTLHDTLHPVSNPRRKQLSCQRCRHVHEPSHSLAFLSSFRQVDVSQWPVKRTSYKALSKAALRQQ